MISTKEESTKSLLHGWETSDYRAGKLWKVAGAVEKVWKSVWVWATAEQGDSNGSQWDEYRDSVSMDSKKPLGRSGGPG